MTDEIALQLLNVQIIFGFILFLNRLSVLCLLFFKSDYLEMTSIKPSSSSSGFIPISKPPPVVEKDPFAPAGIIPSATLQTLDQIGILKIRRNKSLYNATSSLELPNRYFLLDENNRQIFIGHELSDKLCRCFLGRDRAYRISILDENNSGLVGICKDVSPLAVFGCSCFNFGHSAEIVADGGQHLGSIVQLFDCVFPAFQVRNSKNLALYDIISKPIGCCLPWLCGNKRGDFFSHLQTRQQIRDRVHGHRG